ncbi:MAG: PaaI family thioesterase [Puniceicoccaceae bacterium]
MEMKRLRNSPGPAIAGQLHGKCVMCGADNPVGLQLRFARTQPDVVESDLRIPARFQGYNGMAHGGIVASVLDAAMTRCLMAAGVVAVTGDLAVRYKLPVPIGGLLHARGLLEQSTKHVYKMRAELWQQRKLLATATARFVKAPEAFKQAVENEATRRADGGKA